MWIVLATRLGITRLVRLHPKRNGFTTIRPGQCVLLSFDAERAMKWARRRGWRVQVFKVILESEQ